MTRVAYNRNGDKNPRWKGGRRKRKDGYVVVYSPGHPFAYRNFVLEHRLIIEKAIGRFLESHELVHHINEIKDDNRIENLSLMTHREHAVHHFTGKSFLRFVPRASKEEVERLYVEQGLILRECAELLGISYGSFRRHMQHYGISIRGKDSWWRRKNKASRA